VDKSYLDRMIKNIAKNSNANYVAVKQGAYAAKGTDDWIIGNMKKKLSTDTFLSWFRVMVEGNYKQKAKARKYAKHLLGID
tara:strand:- start:914 stop:1156 length:243 start_codon:yes stop_codon:yes gene_type:complete